MAGGKDSMSLIAVQKTLEKGNIQATFTEVPEQTKPRGFEKQKKGGLAKYQGDEQ